MRELFEILYTVGLVLVGLALMYTALGLLNLALGLILSAPVVLGRRVRARAARRRAA